MLLCYHIRWVDDDQINHRGDPLVGGCSSYNKTCWIFPHYIPLTAYWSERQFIQDLRTWRVFDGRCNLVWYCLNLWSTNLIDGLNLKYQPRVSCDRDCVTCLNSLICSSNFEILIAGSDFVILTKSQSVLLRSKTKILSQRYSIIFSRVIHVGGMNL